VPPPTSKPGVIARALVDRASVAPAFSGALKARPMILDHVARDAFPFATTLIAHAVPQRRLWVLCDDTRTQDHVHGESTAWGITASFFPKLSTLELKDDLTDPDTQAERLSTLMQFLEGGSRMLVLCADSLDEEVLDEGVLNAQRKALEPGTVFDMETLLPELDTAGYDRAPTVTERGQFARRGGIVDIFTWNAEHPLRIELIGDQIESLREFDVHTQASVRNLSQASLLLPQQDASATRVPLRSLIKKEDWVITVECDPNGLTPQAVITSGPREGATQEDFSAAIFESPLGVFHAGDFVLHEARRERFTRQIEEWRRDDWRVVVFFSNEAERERFEELAGVEWIAQQRVETTLGLLHRGFTAPAAKIAVITSAEIFGRQPHSRRVRGSKLDEARVLRQAREQLREMREGDLVVHADYGVGRFAGVEVREGPPREEVFVILYADKAKLFVPLGQAHLVSRYVGVGGKAPPLNKLGDARWKTTRLKAERSVEEFAAHLLTTQAQRQTVKGFSHAPDTKWQMEFEQSFLYRETPDQLRSIDEIKRDLELEKPMDRLLCGDVGFGKTEIAIRAAFKAVMNGKQVAVLVPTTVLAQQHLQTFRERMSDYPVSIEMLSRLTPPKKEKLITNAIRDGSVDIVIGTHRLMSKDIHFKDLGLAVVDEEQRFGVKHKERFKELFRLVDVLTLSATPIPRTLYLALMGMRDMSTLDTPPPNRIPVQTTVCGYDERVIRDAVNAELERGGQVFFLHNRVMSIDKMRHKIETLCPDARVLVGHGQMDDTALENVMQRFVDGEADVLVCTTIIESGVDIPNANTIIIDRADRFGLADLYQLRGRVGRSGERAHAWLMLPRDLMTDGDARKRVNAIRQYTALGSGFKIAMRDLEIRGAGNLLGTEQSGHITAVGFDLYCQLLKAATARMQGRRVAPPAEVRLHVDFLCLSEAQYLQIGDGTTAPAFLPTSYIEDPRLRISAYRALGEVTTRKELDQLERDWRDQFGTFPVAVENLLLCAGIKLAAATVSITEVEIKERKLMLTRRGQHLLLSGKFPRLTATAPTLQLRESLQLLRQFKS
jgi:transcription-repair coupling factor (superfamily II helicase)